MNRTHASIVILVLVILLLLSNGWWASRVADAGVKRSYTEVALKKQQAILAQTVAILPVVAHPGVSPAEIVRAASRAAPGSREPFEQNGYVWVGSLGLKFAPEGNLVEAVVGSN